MAHPMAELSFESEAEIDAIDDLATELMRPGCEFDPFTMPHFVEAISEINNFADVQAAGYAQDSHHLGCVIGDVVTHYWRKAAKLAAESFVQRSRP
jgi:hypothetical protein